MPRPNEEASSRRLLTVACCVLTWMLSAQAASAGMVFFDDFDDGNAGDGMPVTWVPGSGTWDASSGDYVATGSLPRVSRVTDHVLGDTSARTQARVVGNVAVNLAVRRPGVNEGYAGVIRPDGSMTIARFGVGLPVALGSAVVPFNPVQQDVMLQFDAFGDKLSLWAWPVGELMPNQPQVVVFDNTYAEGPVGLISSSAAALPSDSTTYRFIHVASTHIHEESTFSAWAIDAEGTWSQASNWENGIVRNAADALAELGGVITQPRTVNLDMPITVGRIDFKNSNGYTVAGTNSITLDVTNGFAEINVTSGSHMISAPVIMADNATVSVSPAVSNLAITGGLNAGNVSLVKAGAGTLTVNQLRAAGVTINGGKIVLAAGSSVPAVIGAPTIPGGLAPTATLDLTDNAAVLDYSGTNTVARVRAQLLAGRQGPGPGGSWTGMGITSSTAAAANQAQPDSRSLGYADNATLPLGAYATFHGEPADNTSVLVAFTRTGDANLDGVVNDDDVTIVGATYAPGVPQPSWALGDFDYNGFVDDDDVTLLGAFYDPSAPPLAAPSSGAAAAAVPEPRSLVLALLAAAGIGIYVVRRRATHSGKPDCLTDKKISPVFLARVGLTTVSAI